MTSRFVPVQLGNGQWRVLDTATGRQHGQAVRYESEAALRAARLEEMHRS